MDTTLVRTPGAAAARFGTFDVGHEPAAFVVRERRSVNWGWSALSVAFVPLLWIDLFLLQRAAAARWIDAAAIAGLTLTMLVASILTRRAAMERLLPSDKANHLVGAALGSLVALPYGAFAPRHREDRHRARRADGSTWALSRRADAGLAADATWGRMLGYRAWVEGPGTTTSLLATLVLPVAMVVASGGDPMAAVTLWAVPLALGIALSALIGVRARVRLSRIDRRPYVFDVVPERAPIAMTPESAKRAISVGV